MEFSTLINISQEHVILYYIHIQLSVPIHLDMTCFFWMQMKERFIAKRRKTPPHRITPGGLGDDC